MIRDWIKGLLLLRYPELIRDLGERRFHLLEMQKIKAAFPDAKITNDVRLVNFQLARLYLGTHSSVCEGTVLAFGDNTNGFGRIQIGNDSWVGQYNNLRASGDADIRIGANCLISQFCTLVGTNHACAKGTLILRQGPDLRKQGIVLGDDVWLGAGVSVMPGVTIGNGAVIGANSVVTKDVPENEIWAGTPAAKISERQ